MSAPRSRQQRAARQRSWSEVPHLWPFVTAPLLAAFTTGPPVDSCPHLDGLAHLEDLTDVAAWSPALVRALTCRECFDDAVAVRRVQINNGEDPGSRCDCCGRVVPGMTTFTNAHEPGALLIIAAFCDDCLTASPGEAA